MNNVFGIGFTSKIVPVKPINDQMTLCKCYVLAIGKNQNKSNISKEAVDDALPSLFNIPVVGHLFVDKDNNVRMGGHDMALERDEDGKYKFRVLTVPYGTVPQQDNVHYEEVEEKDGTVNTYQVADIILWTGRYPELLDAKYSDGIYFAQSMEIIPLETSKEDGYTNIDKFQYSALCLLGKSDDKSKNVEPCFRSARVEPYDFSATDEWAKLFGEFKEELARCYEKRDIEEGGKKELNAELIKKILAEFGLAEDTELSFEVSEDMTEEMFREKIQEVYASANQEGGQSSEGAPTENPEANDGTFTANTDDGANAANPAVEPVAEPVQQPEPVKFSVELTYEEKRKKIYAALESMGYWNETEYKYYVLNDFDNDYVYSYYRFAGENIKEDCGNLRIPYTFNDDTVVLDMGKAESVRLVWLTKAEEEKLSAEKAQLNELIKYKEDRIEDDRKKEYAAVIADFSDLSEIDEYKTVVKDAMTFESVDALTEKLYAIRGRYAKKPAKKPLDTIKIPVGFGAKNEQMSEVDEFMNKYLTSKTNK